MQISNGDKCMDTLDDFSLKQKKYIPDFPKASGNPTVYIEGYPFEDDEPMAATEFHGLQIATFFHQLSVYFHVDPHIHVGIDSFIYYQEGDIRKVVAPDIFVVFGVDKYPLRRSFYTWAEGTAPVAVFEFLSDATAHHDRNDKADLYLHDIGVQEYFIHQPEMDKKSEFRGWQRSASGEVTEIEPHDQGGIFSNALNLLFRWEEQQDTHVRLLRPFLPDGTPVNTPFEDKQLRIHEEELRLQEQELRLQEQALRIQEQENRKAAEAKAAEEIERRQELETELRELRKQLAHAENDNT